jgi:hypothetical protein
LALLAFVIVCLGALAVIWPAQRVAEGPLTSDLVRMLTSSSGTGTSAAAAQVRRDLANSHDLG